MFLSLFPTVIKRPTLVKSWPWLTEGVCSLSKKNLTNVWYQSMTMIHMWLRKRIQAKTREHFLSACKLEPRQWNLGPQLREAWWLCSPKLCAAETAQQKDTQRCLWARTCAQDPDTDGKLDLEKMLKTWVTFDEMLSFIATFLAMFSGKTVAIYSSLSWFC